MKYFIHTRKSSDSEERQILSIEAQLTELKEFAAKEKLEIVLSASASRRGGRKGGSGGISPAEPIARKISSNFFKYTPPFFIFCENKDLRKIKIVVSKSKMQGKLSQE